MPSVHPSIPQSPCSHLINAGSCLSMVCWQKRNLHSRCCLIKQSLVRPIRHTPHGCFSNIAISWSSMRKSYARTQLEWLTALHCFTIGNNYCAHHQHLWFWRLPKSHIIIEWNPCTSMSGTTPTPRDAVNKESTFWCGDMRSIVWNSLAKGELALPRGT